MIRFWNVISFIIRWWEAAKSGRNYQWKQERIKERRKIIQKMNRRCSQYTHPFLQRVPLFSFVSSKMVILKAEVQFRNFSMDKKNNFSETRKYFPRVRKNFRRVGKIWFCKENPCDVKSYDKSFSKKTIILLRISFAFLSQK